ncbi:hypothetical protein H2248_006489 [Termitomyces sp. 'cryptogamus']|nr:hypothetical protein H2248_006489 [Termitomyces sp. 'cryptogamus']
MIGHTKYLPVLDTLSYIYHKLRDFTTCQLKQPVDVRIAEQIRAGCFCHDTKKLHILPAGSSVTVFDGRAVNLTRGVNDPLSIDNVGYRVEGELEFTVYESIAEELSGVSDAKLCKHSNFRPVDPACNPNILFVPHTIVALRESGTYKGVGTVPRGKLFAITSNAKTPRGQKIARQELIEKAVYNIVAVKKVSRMLKVRNFSNRLVLHKHLQRMP